MEVRQDVSLPELGDFRWLTVGPPGQDDVSIVLMAVPGEPVMDEATQEAGAGPDREGFRRAPSFSPPRTARPRYEEMKARGVEFTEEPHQMPYGIDCGFRDPSGNSVRLTQLAEIPANTG